MPNRKNTPESFWSRANKTDNCWEYTGPKNGFTQGYALTHYEGKYWTVSRLAWVLTYGSIPDGLLICHHCDNPRCVRPDHLFLGTYTDNNRDKSAKGRAKSGGDKLRKLTDEQIVEVFSKHRSGRYSTAMLGIEYNVSQQCMSDWISKMYKLHNIQRNDQWRGGGQKKNKVYNEIDATPGRA